ncbi:hypothetical protein KAU11_04750 [Candidatus Babeliales bacterium]|nr:hypothetical protein [Candidatus Babeliales bacterium]
MRKQILLALLAVTIFDSNVSAKTTKKVDPTVKKAKQLNSRIKNKKISDTLKKASDTFADTLVNTKNKKKELKKDLKEAEKTFKDEVNEFRKEDVVKTAKKNMKPAKDKKTGKRQSYAVRLHMALKGKEMPEKLEKAWNQFSTEKERVEGAQKALKEDEKDAANTFLDATKEDPDDKEIVDKALKSIRETEKRKTENRKDRS